VSATLVQLAAVVLLGVSGAARAADDYKELILGTWEVAYSDAKDIAVGTKLEFTADGKLKLTAKRGGKEDTTDASGYRVDKQYFALTGRDGTKNDRGRILLLNRTSFVLHDELEDKLLVLKKVTKK
jgi:uncharacterized protein (TIGR03066 family)